MQKLVATLQRESAHRISKKPESLKSPKSLTDRATSGQASKCVELSRVDRHRHPLLGFTDDQLEGPQSGIWSRARDVNLCATRKAGHFSHG